MADWSLRPYQRTACRAVWDGWRDKPAQLVVMATGLGKSVVCSALAKRRRGAGRVLWLAHRKELLLQAKEHLERAGMTVDVERAEDRASRNPNGSDVVVASVPTLRGDRLDTWPRHAFATIIVDEAHHSSGARTWMDILTHFDKDHLGRRVRIAGATATPDRTDGIALGHVYDEAAYKYELREAVKDGWLVKPSPRTVVCDDIDLGSLRTIGADLNAMELDAHMARKGAIHQMASPLAHVEKSALAREIAGRSCVVYMPGVESARLMEEVLSGYVGADQVKCVIGKTSTDVRTEALAAFERQEIRWLVNVGVYTEGWDCPLVSVIANGRPTKSRSLLAQIMGRGTRTLPETNVDQYGTADERLAAIAASPKPECMFIDFTGRDEIRTASPADALAGEDLPEETAKVVKELQAEDRDRDLESILAEAEERAAESEAGRELAKRRARVKAVVDYVTHRIELVDFGDAHISLVEEARKAARGARRRACKRCDGTGLRKSDAAPCGVCKGKGRVKGVDFYESGPTQKQLDKLAKWGIKMPTTALKRQASAAITLIDSKGLCSLKQAKYLRRAGLRTNLHKAEASKAIEALAQNKWRATPEIQERWG